MSFEPRTPPVRSRLPQVGTTIFTVMSALAQQHGLDIGGLLADLFAAFLNLLDHGVECHH